jgi:nucleotidyltransferase substrate binding protein (TIGR01987 family)
VDVKLKAFQEAAATFSYLARLDQGALKTLLGDERLIDGMQNGRAQKFEYTTELCWKAIKGYLKASEGIDEASPKKVIKAYYLAGQVTEDDYLLLLSAVEDKNILSHVYDKATFDAILGRLPDYAALFERVIEKLLKTIESSVK